MASAATNSSLMASDEVGLKELSTEAFVKAYGKQVSVSTCICCTLSSRVPRRGAALIVAFKRALRATPGWTARQAPSPLPRPRSPAANPATGRQ